MKAHTNSINLKTFLSFSLFFLLLALQPFAAFGQTTQQASGDLSKPANEESAQAPEDKINQSCREQTAINAALDQLRTYYELGDISGLQTRLGPALIGYSTYVEGFKREIIQFKQRQLTFSIGQYQCGPEVSVVSMNWEKRFIDVVSFKPGLISGRSTFLLQRDMAGGWKMIATAGDNLFATSSGTTATITATGSIDSAILFPALPNGGIRSNAIAPVSIEITDADKIGSGSVNILVSTDYGDIERLTIPETSPGRFSLPGIAVVLAPPSQYNGSLELVNARQIEINYVDERSDNFGSPRVLRTRVQVANNTALLGPNPFSFSAIPPQLPNVSVSSNTITLSGLTASAIASVTTPGQLIVDGVAVPSGTAVRNGQTIAVRITSGVPAGSVVSSTLSINGISAFVAVTTLSVTTPTPFAIPTVIQTGVAIPGSNLQRFCAVGTITSSLVTITGINTSVPVTVVPANGYNAAATSGAAIGPNGALTLTATKLPNVTPVLFAPSTQVVATVIVGSSPPVTWNVQCI